MEIIPFDFGGKRVRTVVIDNQPWFVGKDACDILGYMNSSKAMNDHCRGVTKRYPLETPGGVQEFRIINEPDLYRLTTNSKLPDAVEFEKWVFEKMIPSVRKTGVYLTDEKAREIASDPYVLRGIADQVIALNEAVAEKNLLIEQKDIQIEAAAPAVAFVNTLTASTASMLIGDFAKILVKSGIKTGRNRLCAWFRDNGYLLTQAGSLNHPSQRSSEIKLFEIKPYTILNPGKKDKQKITTFLTGKGQAYFFEMFRESGVKELRGVKKPKRKIKKLSFNREKHGEEKRYN